MMTRCQHCTKLSSQLNLMVQGMGNGLFLVSNTKVNQIEWGGKGSGDYCNALKIAAKDHSSFGADNGCAWLGTVNSGDAWCAD